MAKRKSKFDNKFKSESSHDKRKENIKTERKVSDDLPKLSLNFKDFDLNQCPPGQTFSQWQEDGRLSELMEKFVSICAYNRIEAEQRKLLKIYGKFPSNSDFSIPSYIVGDVASFLSFKQKAQIMCRANMIGKVAYHSYCIKKNRYSRTLEFELFQLIRKGTQSFVDYRNGTWTYFLMPGFIL